MSQSRAQAYLLDLSNILCSSVLADLVVSAWKSPDISRWVTAVGTYLAALLCSFLITGYPYSFLETNHRSSLQYLHAFGKIRAGRALATGLLLLTLVSGLLRYYQIQPKA